MKGSLRSRAQFQRVYEQGRKAISRHMVVFSLPDAPAFGLGVVASRKVGDAVRRNRAKRLLREAVRAHRDQLAARQWLVLVARRNLVEDTLSPQHIAAELSQLLAQVGGLAEGAERESC